MDILLASGIRWPTIVFTPFMDWVVIITGLIGAFVKSHYKCGHYTIDCFAMFYVFHNIAWEAASTQRNSAESPTASTWRVVC